MRNETVNVTFPETKKNVKVQPTTPKDRLPSPEKVNGIPTAEWTPGLAALIQKEKEVTQKGENRKLSV